MRHFLSVNDLSVGDIRKIFSLADKARRGASIGNVEGTLALFFQKPSTRTRVSFESAMIRLGGHSIYIDASTSQFSRGESPGDTARILSLYVDFVAARLYRHVDLEEMASFSHIPVINALTDLEHPTQALADMYTMKEVKGTCEGLRIAFIGDIATNTANSLMLAATKLGSDIRLVGPKNFRPNAEYVAMARRQGSVEIYDSVAKGLDGADVIYTDTFVSMGMEKEAAKRRRLFRHYRLDSRAVGYAKKDAIVMHCLPAHRGEEITSEVLDGQRSVVWKQAGNKMLIEEALLGFLG
jgi:ornithine carbamoyltransferase